MGKSLTYTLLSDGTSDATLKFPVNWTLRQFGVKSFVDQWADLRLHPSESRRLRDKLRVVQEDYPCDLLVVHRDSERKSLAARLDEIKRELLRAAVEVRAVCLVPVRMTEAWLLHDEQAIRRAAGNPGGRAPITLPVVSAVERESNPKMVLRRALLDASEARGRRRKQKARDFALMRFRVAELITDWAPLRRLPAFNQFEDMLRSALDSLNIQ